MSEVARPRHPALVRVTHWLTALAFLALLVTGVEILISHPRFYWGETGNVNTRPLFSIPIPSSRSIVPTGYGYVLPDQNGWSRYLHFEAAWLAVLTGLLYVAFGFLEGHFRRTLFPSPSEFAPGRLVRDFAKHVRFARPGRQADPGVQPDPAFHVSAGRLRVVPPDCLDGAVYVARFRVGVSGGSVDSGWAAVCPHDTFLRFALPGSVRRRSRRDGVSRRIPTAGGRHDHRPSARITGASMSTMTRRTLITTGLVAGVGFSARGIAKLAGRYGLIPPDSGVLYGAGETLTYAAQRLLTRHSMAREFDRSRISEKPFANVVDPPVGDDFRRLERGGFADWRLAVDGLVSRPAQFSLAELRNLPMRSQVTSIACEEGWSVHRRVERRAALSRPGSCGRPARGALRSLPFDSARLVGQHRHGRCAPSPDVFSPSA